MDFFDNLKEPEMLFEDDDTINEISGLFIVSEPLISTQVYRQDIKVVSKAELSVEWLRSIC